MNENITKENLLNKIQSIIKKNNRYFVYFLIFMFLIFISFQYYLFNQNNRIMNSSLIYNDYQFNKSDLDLKNNLIKLTNEKNFYSILAEMELIKLDLDNKNIDAAFLGYLNLLEKKKLDNLYQAAIAMHGSFAILNSLDSSKNLNENFKNSLIDKINKLLSYVDNKLISYTGPKLEVLYLLSTLSENNSSNYLLNEESQKIFLQIQENDKISSSLKERVKKIHEFHKYK